MCVDCEKRAQAFVIPVFVGSMVSGLLGYLSGRCIRLLDVSVIPAAHGVVFGILPIMTIGAYVLADKINKGAIISNALLALAAGYIASYAASNAIGLSISLAGPIASFSILAITSAIIGGLAVPYIICAGLGLGLIYREQYNTL